MVQEKKTLPGKLPRNWAKAKNLEGKREEKADQKTPNHPDKKKKGSAR